MKLVKPHALWDDQPVFHFIDDSYPEKDKAINKSTDPSKVSKDALALPAGFSWVSIDISSDEDGQKVVDFLNSN
jgi:hypothetical protein